VADVLPNLQGLIHGVFCAPADGEQRMGEVDAVFVALPHNESQEVIPRLAQQHRDTLFVDMAGDFRTNDPAGYEKHYGQPHSAPEWLGRFVYGFTEFQRERLKGARLVANPGCFATGMLLALCPLARARKLGGDVCVTGITGSSGAGNKPSATTHHPERATNVRSYKPLAHQHLLEVESFVRGLTPSDFRLHFVPQSGPFVRGIFTTVFLPGSSAEELEAIFRAAYAGEPLVSVVQGSPELRWVQGGPRAFIGVAGDGSRGVVFTVIDNLGKGAAGQALQNLNAVFGFPRDEGLAWPGGFV
jgi:N-acetyl-gamma-glutamyl-phosphate reductase